MFKSLAFIFYSELLLQLRQKHAWLYPLCFYSMALCFVPFLFPNNAELNYFLPGYFWIIALFASILSIQTIFLTDIEDGHLEQLILCNIPFPCIIFLKLVVQWFVTQLPLILLTPLLGMLLNMPANMLVLLCFTLLLGTPIFTFIGSFAVALTLGLRQGGILLSLLVLPLITPIVIFGVNILQQAMAGLNIAGPLAFLAALMLLSISLIPFATASILRLLLDE